MIETIGALLLVVLSMVSAVVLLARGDVFRVSWYLKSLAFFTFMVSMVSGFLTIGSEVLGWPESVVFISNTALIYSTNALLMVFLQVHLFVISKRARKP